MASAELARAWENAYAHYGDASDAELPLVSRQIAAAWRDMAAVWDLPWWLLAAVVSAAEAFEMQADEWESCSRTQEIRGYGV